MRLALAMAFSSALGAGEAAKLDARPMSVGGELADPTATAASGASGLQRVETAEPASAGELVVGLAGEYFATRGFLVAGDDERRSSGHLVLSFSPLERLTVWGSWSSVSSSNDRLTPRTTGYRGNPTLGGKLRVALAPGVDVGAMLSVTIPTSAGGSGLDAGAAVYDARAIASYRVARGIVVAANAGYVVDRSAGLFGRDIGSAERFSAGVYGTDSVVLGGGAQALFEPLPVLAAGGFAEITANLPTGGGADVTPARATLGLKALAPPWRSVEVVLGCDLRLSGAPRAGATLPGIPPWEGFLRVAGHWTVPGMGASPLAGGESCGRGSTCRGGLACDGGRCVPRAAAKAPTFEIAGRIVDETTGAPLPKATVSVLGVDAGKVAVDPATGSFRVGPVAVDGGLVQVRAEASGYGAAEKTFAKGPAGTVKELRLALVPLARAAGATLKGIIIDAVTGHPVRGVVSLPALRKKVTAAADGSFALEVKAGRWEVGITDPRHVPQTKTVTLEPGDVVILNVDMAPQE